MASFTVGLDLGQGSDFSALVVAEWVKVLPPGVPLRAWLSFPEAYEDLREEVHVRHLQRWELGTAYPSVVADVSVFMQSKAMADGLLVVDATGVGRAIMDLLYAADLEGRRSGAGGLGCLGPRGLTVTGGRKRHRWNYPKKDLLAAVQAPLQSGRLKIADGLVLGPVLEKELVSFRQTLSQSGRESFDVQRRAGEGHGDLVSALMIACVVPNTAREPEVIEDANSVFTDRSSDVSR